MPGAIGTVARSEHLIKITPTAADDWERCQGLYEARHIRHLPSTGHGGTGSRSALGLLAHAAIHRWNHALLNDGVKLDPAEAIDRTIAGHRFASHDDRASVVQQVEEFLIRYVEWNAKCGYRLRGAELSLTTTADALPHRPEVRVYLDGRVDWFGMRPDGIPAIVDYKTSANVTTSEELATHLSPLNYGMLAAHHLRRGGEARLDRLEFGILFLRSGIYVPTCFTQRDVLAAQGRLIELATGIADGSVLHTSGPHCRGCPLIGSCPTFHTPGELFTCRDTV